jgi:hypothetical protein
LALCSPGVVRPGGDEVLVESCAAAAKSSHKNGVGLLHRPWGRPWRSMLILPLLLVGRPISLLLTARRCRGRLARHVILPRLRWRPLARSSQTLGRRRTWLQGALLLDAWRGGGGEVATAPRAAPLTLLLSLPLGQRHGVGAAASSASDQKLRGKQPMEGKCIGSGDDGP